jgi:hypothetical protein
MRRDLTWALIAHKVVNDQRARFLIACVTEDHAGGAGWPLRTPTGEYSIAAIPPFTSAAPRPLTRPSATRGANGGIVVPSTGTVS